MKKEMLRINHLNYSYTRRRKLENISLCILEGECVGFLGLSYSGKNLLVGLLTGDSEENIQNGSVYIDGKPCYNWKMLGEKIYRITVSNYIIDDWTVAEYIELVDSGWLYTFCGTGVLEKKAAECFSELEISFDVSRKIHDLSEREKRVVDLVKAYRKGAKVVVIEDEFEGMSLEEINRFGRIMKKIISGRMSVIVSSHSNESMTFLSDKYIIFNKGCIVKKCSKDYIKSEAHLESFLLGHVGLSEKTTAYEKGRVSKKDVVYQVKNLRLMRNNYENFQFFRGEVVTFLVLDRKEKERIFMNLAGRSDEEHTYYILAYKKYENADPHIFFQEKVVSVKYMGSREEVFPRMTVGENLLIPSLEKISSVEYVASSSKISHMLVADAKNIGVESNVKAGKLEINDLIGMTMERWYIYNPKVLVLLEPFALCDIEGISIVKSYIEKFAKRGTLVIIVKTREEYVEDISDRIISVD